MVVMKANSVASGEVLSNESSSTSAMSQVARPVSSSDRLLSTKLAKRSTLRAKAKHLKTIVSSAVLNSKQVSAIAARKKVSALVTKAIQASKGLQNVQSSFKSRSRRRSSSMTGGFEDEGVKRVRLDYGSREYWETRYEEGEDVKRGFEWFLSYSDVEPILRECIDYNDRTSMLIDVGCGTSKFLHDLKASGYAGHCLGLDYSEKAIETMKARPSSLPGLDFKVCDATEMTSLVKGAAVIVDKSLMDTLLHTDDEELVPRMLQAVTKSLRPDGIFVCITQLNPYKQKDLHYLNTVMMENLSSAKYHTVSRIVAHRCASANGEEDDENAPIPTVLVCYFSSETSAVAENGVPLEIIDYESSEDGSQS